MTELSLNTAGLCGHFKLHFRSGTVLKRLPFKAVTWTSYVNILYKGMHVGKGIQCLAQLISVFLRMMVLVNAYWTYWTKMVMNISW